MKAAGMKDEVKAFKQLKLSFHPSRCGPHPFFSSLL
jgi:hypothetical protein